MIWLGMIIGVDEEVASVTELGTLVDISRKYHVVPVGLAVGLVAVNAVACGKAVAPVPHVAHDSLIAAELTIVVAGVLKNVRTSALGAGAE